MTITLANGQEYGVISNGNHSSYVAPSENPNIRSKMYIYMEDYTMSLESFIELFTNEKNLEAITFKGDNFENEYLNYTFVQSVGKEIVRTVDNLTGEISERYCLVAKLEQLTYIEQQLKNLGIIN